MAATYTQFGGARERVNCVLRLAATNRFGAAQKDVWDMLRLDATCLGFVNFQAILGKSAA